MSMLIDGAWLDGPGRHTVTNPADRSVVGEIAYGGKDEATRAADAAARAFADWAARPARERADLLLDGAATLSDRADEIALLLTRETGKRLPEARGEVTFSAEYFRWFAEEVRRPTGRVHRPENPAKRHLSLRVPSGVAVTLTPWNFPLSIQARKLAPALAAGCTVVARASEKAPLAVTELVRCFELPPGVLQLVHGPAAEVTDALLAHPAVRVASFTGSTQVGRRVMAAASARVVRPLLELGGDAPFLVFDDADIDRAVEGAMVAKFRNNGQSCIAANRFLVQAGAYDEFVAKLSDRIGAMRVGDPTADPLPDLGPLIDDDRVAAVSGLLADALDRGGRLAGRTPDVPHGGSYLAPALVTDVPPDAALATTEVFGPIAGVFRFEREEEAIARANDTEMGLAAYAFTTNTARSWRIAEALEAGIVGINDALPSVAYAPMGGVKQSGLGREGAELGLEEFEDVRYVCVGL